MVQCTLIKNFIKPRMDNWDSVQYNIEKTIEMRKKLIKYIYSM